MPVSEIHWLAPRNGPTEAGSLNQAAIGKLVKGNDTSCSRRHQRRGAWVLPLRGAGARGQVLFRL